MKLKKTTIVCLSALLSLAYAHGQSFKTGDKNFNFMLGLGSYGVWNGGVGYKAQLPLISASFDYGMRDDWGPGVFGIGAYAGMQSYKNEYFRSNSGSKYFTTTLASRATYHYQFIDKLDTYGGFILGIDIVSRNPYGNTTDISDNSVDPAFGAFVGVKYYFKENLAVMSEIGYGTALFNIGICLKL